jgi:predicted HicB family RNase H-like nuclease
MKHLADRYAYRVIWSEEDQEFVGLCAEMPSLSWLEEDRTKALEGIVQVVKEVLDDMQQNGEQPPVPLSERQYSGELRLRMPPRLHQRLAVQAAEEHTSINKLILKQIC